MLGEGTSTRLIKFYNPVVVGKALGGIREREREEGRKRRKERGRERKEKQNSVALVKIHHREDRAADLFILPVLCAAATR